MELDINKDCGIALIWLTQEESADPAVSEHLKPVYAKCRAQGLMAAVMHSGKEDLYANTRDLLVENRRRQAEKEVRAELIDRGVIWDRGFSNFLRRPRAFDSGQQKR